MAERQPFPIDVLYEEVQQAFEQAESDNPGVECGYEYDVAKSVLEMAEGEESDKDEVWRMLFGTKRPK
jgi:hypothetical protein